MYLLVFFIAFLTPLDPSGSDGQTLPTSAKEDKVQTHDDFKDSSFFDFSVLESLTARPFMTFSRL
jgi:hypothetical protein